MNTTFACMLVKSAAYLRNVSVLAASVCVSCHEMQLAENSLEERRLAHTNRARDNGERALDPHACQTMHMYFSDKRVDSSKGVWI